MATVAPSIYYTEASRWFQEQLLNLAPGTQNGGIYANKPGYHNTRDQNLPTNYSVVQPPDKLGPGNKAAGYDWTFPEAQGNTPDYSRIALYSGRLRAAGQANDPRTDGWREFYGQADTDIEVEGWDFYFNRAASSDSSHLWHIHLSELRKFTEDRLNKEAMLSILRGETLEEWLASQGGGMANPNTVDNMDRWLSAILTNSEMVTGIKDPRGNTSDYKNWLHVPIPTTGGGEAELVPHTHDVPGGTTGPAEEEPVP